MPELVIPHFGKYKYVECKTPEEFVKAFTENDAAISGGPEGALTAWRKRGSYAVHVVFDVRHKTVWSTCITAHELLDTVREQWSRMGDLNKPPSEEDIQKLRDEGKILF